MHKKINLLTIFGFVGLLAVVVAQESVIEGPLIPENKIDALHSKFIKTIRETKVSSVRKRRAYKGIVREGIALIRACPSAQNRFRVLEVIIQSQKKLLSLQKNNKTREAVYSTAEKLAKAPDEYAEIRFKAELLLSEKELAQKENTTEEHGAALAKILEHYHGNPAEAKILMRGIVIAANLNAYELKETLLDRLDEGFMDNEEVINFVRQMRLTNLRVSFKNELTRLDDTKLRFPNDTVGKLCIMAFWSKDNPHLEKILKYIKGLELKYPGILDVFSCNLDRLPDGGKSKLSELGLDWEVMVLPMGRNDRVYSTYAKFDPSFVLVDAYGYSMLRSSVAINSIEFKKTKDGEIVIPAHLKISESLFRLDRFLNQIQSIHIGDFLINDYADTFEPSFPPELLMASSDHSLSKIKASLTPVQTNIPAVEWQVIQDCFIDLPFRYRLSRLEILSNYRKAEALCREAIKKYPDDPAVWMLRNRRIIALMGMWQAAHAPEYLDQAVLEAKASLATKLGRGADVVPHFCLAKAAFRQAEINPEESLSTFIKNSGGLDAPASAIASAATLALFDVRKRSVYEHYRESVLSVPKYGNPLLWPVRSFLVDRCQSFYYLGHRRGRGHIIHHANEAMRTPMPEFSLNTLDGKKIILPIDSSDAQTLLLFIEPPADSKADFPLLKDQKGNRVAEDSIRDMMVLAEKLMAQKKIKKVNVIVAFLSDDTEQVRHLMKINGWTCQAAMLPGGLSNPMVRCLNILSADRVPNAFLVRRDGTISWSMSGIKYGESNSFPVELALRVHFERNEVEWGLKALIKGDDKEAAQAFSGPFLRNLTNRYHWRGPRYHGLTMSHIVQKNWQAALEAIDVAIFEHMARHSHGIPRPRRSSTEQKSKFGEKVLKEKPCEIISEMWRIKSIILEKLKRDEEASVFRKLADKPSLKDEQNAYNAIHYKLMAFKTKLGF